MLHGLTPGRVFAIEIGVFDSVGNAYSSRHQLTVNPSPLENPIPPQGTRPSSRSLRTLKVI